MRTAAYITLKLSRRLDSEAYKLQPQVSLSQALRLIYRDLFARGIDARHLANETLWPHIRPGLIDPG
jgi:hypothetical protein